MSEDFLSAIEAGKNRAKKLFDKDNQSIESLKDLMRWTICQARNKCFFDPYFDDLTDEDLAFESFCIKEQEMLETTPSAQRVVERTKKNIEKVQEEFADWKEEDSDEQFVDNALSAWDNLESNSNKE